MCVILVSACLQSQDLLMWLHLYPFFSRMCLVVESLYDKVHLASMGQCIAANSVLM